MKKLVRYLVTSLGVGVLGVYIGHKDVMAIEEAAYTVSEGEMGFEIRQYDSHIVAETFVEGEFDAVGNEGFRRLAAYINGKNRKKQSISMTAPVSQEESSEKISMTAPVNQQRQNGKW